MTAATVPTLRTPGVLASDLDVPLHRVLYLLRTRANIKPVARAGSLRLYDAHALTLLRTELDCMDCRKRGAA